MSVDESLVPKSVGISPAVKPLAITLLGSMIDSLTKSGSGVLPASPVSAVSRLGPTAPVAPAEASVWHEPQPLATHTALPAVASPPPPPVEPPPVLPLGVEVLGGVDADGVYVESGSAPNPWLDAPLVSVPEIAITTTITTMPTMVPTRAATRTFIIAWATLPA